PVHRRAAVGLPPHLVSRRVRERGPEVRSQVERDQGPRASAGPSRRRGDRMRRRAAYIAALLVAAGAFVACVTAPPPPPPSGQGVGQNATFVLANPPGFFPPAGPGPAPGGVVAWRPQRDRGQRP